MSLIGYGILADSCLSQHFKILPGLFSDEKSTVSHTVVSSFLGNVSFLLLLFGIYFFLIFFHFTMLV